MNKDITGVMVYYYRVCHRKLWYFYHEIGMEQENENVEIGKIIDQETYQRDEKHINIDNIINIDFIKNKNILHEVKKSRKIEEAGQLQVKYYLYYLKKRGITMTAQIDYPLLRQTVEVVLTEEDMEIMDNILDDIKLIVNQEKPSQIRKSRICKSCAYFDLCYI